MRAGVREFLLKPILQKEIVCIFEKIISNNLETSNYNLGKVISVFSNKGGIGKTSIVLRFIGNYFSRSFKPSNGVFRIDHQLYHLIVAFTIRMVDGEQINLIVNDFPGTK